MGKQLSLLHQRKSPVLGSGLLCRGPHLAMADEETWSSHRKRTRLVRLPSLLRPTRKLWREGNVEQFLLSTLRLERFRRGWMRTPAYISAPGEPDHNERCTPGSEGGHQRPTAVMSHGAGARPYPTSQQRKGKYLGKAGGLICEPLKAASMRRLALSRFLSLLLHLFFP
jgi:hypothetical protein